MTISAQLTSVMGSETPVDVMALLGRCLGNFQMVGRVLSKFRETGRIDIDRLQQAIGAHDLAASEQFAHRLKGAASNVSAVGLGELFDRAEQLAQQQNLAALQDIMIRLEPEWEEFERFSQAFAPGSGNSSCGAAKTPPCPLESSHAGARC